MKRQGIRGRDASASLKQARRDRPMARRPMHPRQRCLGLIEALPLGMAAVEKVKKHPRQRCLGLIEARVGVRRPDHFQRGIRGRDASASLKPGRQALYARRQRDGIRGRDASASLKPGRQALYARRQRDGIRGRDASASLKRRIALVLLLARRGRHPRQRCLGLIEAYRLQKWK